MINCPRTTPSSRTSLTSRRLDQDRPKFAELFKTEQKRKLPDGILTLTPEAFFSLELDMADIKASILIVEDDESVRPFLAQVFTHLGYRTRSATDGLSALIEIRQEVPDILLSDLNMPAMSGFELLSIIHRRFPAIYVIAMSGMFTQDQIPCGVTADAFYQKGGGVCVIC